MTSLQENLFPDITRKDHVLPIGTSSSDMCESHNHNQTFLSLKPREITLCNENQKGDERVNADPAWQNWMNNLFFEFFSLFFLQVACKQFTLFLHFVLFKIICWIISAVNSWSAYPSWAVQ